LLLVAIAGIFPVVAPRRKKLRIVELVQGRPEFNSIRRLSFPLRVAA
jgi:hypothetical protein